MRVRYTGNSVIGVVFLLAFGLVFTGAGGYFYLEQKEDLEEHEPVKATVVSTHVHKEVDDTGTPDVDYYGVVVYEYEVDGERYRSSTLYPGGVNESHNSRSEAEAFIEDYPPGTEVTAYYDPAEPSDAYLIDEGSFVPHLLGGFGVLMIVLAAVMLVKRTRGSGATDNA